MFDNDFMARTFNGNTWVIEGAGCSSYLLLGKQRAAMVDTGMSVLNLREYLRKITHLPVFVINTHGHFDHTGGNGWFDEVYMHPLAVKDCRVPVFQANLDDYPCEYAIRTVKEGHVFDLGGRHLEVIGIPAHSAGSIALLDHENRLLFSGDEIESGQVLLIMGNQGCQAVEAHQWNMKRLRARSGEFDSICPSHNGTPIHNSYIDAFIENAKRIMDGIEGSTKYQSPTFPVSDLPGEEFIRRSEFKGSALVYDKRRIFSEKLNAEGET
jgi:hydroxyacylglutathione hydrolase